MTVEIDIIREIEELQDEARQLFEQAVSSLLITPTSDSVKKTQIQNSFQAARNLAILP